MHMGALDFVTRAIRWRERGTAVYVKGSFAFDDPVYGVSDIDMVVVTPDHPSRPGENRVRVQRRWERLGRLAPPIRQLVQHSSVYEESELREVTDATCFTFGTGSGGRTRASNLGARPLTDDMGLLSHPPLSSPHREWRLVAGPERRNGIPVSDAQGRRIAGWLELQFLWKLAYLAARDPDSPHVPYLCVKLVADPVRILLWIANGELVLRRKDALVRGLAVLPEEERALRRALDLTARLDREANGSLAEFFPLFLGLSSRIAARIVADVAEEGATPVRMFAGAEPDLAVRVSARESFRRLVPAGVSPRLLPLVDWRALVTPPPPDETFAVVPGDGGALASISRLAQELPAGEHAALRMDGLLLKPARMLSHRTVQCEVTDPVSFALVAERKVAAFPNVPGWSAQDWARRAVAEHRAWLQSRRRIPDTEPGERESVLEQLGRLLTASRAALFQESLASGEPELALSLAAVAERLRARDPEAGSVAEEAVAAYRSGRRDNRPVPTPAVGAMADIVRRLPAYRDDGGLATTIGS
jgi:predicted nucleotidyltransferase